MVNQTWTGLRRNKPNSSIADCGLCKTNPTCPPDGQAGSWLEPIVRNKPKLGRPGASGGRRVGEAYRAEQSQFRQRVERVKCLRGKELWWIGHAGDFGETKPIGRSQSCDNASLPGVVPATDPIWHPGQAGGVPAGAKRAKQSQFPAPGGTGPAGRGAIVRNKPNFPRAGSPGPTDRAKQSQFGWPGYASIPAFQPDAVRAKQSQLPEAGHRGGVGGSARSDGCGIRHPMPATPVAHGKLDFALRDLPISPGSGSIRLLWLHPHFERQER
jgi:hypothetical protein